MRLAKRIIDSLNPLQTASLKDTHQVKEKVYTPKHSLGVKRKDMPQIEDADFPDFLSWLREEGYGYESRTMDPTKVIPAQNEIDASAAQHLVDSKSTKLKKPVIISKDSYIVDGHHRWYAHILKEETKMPVIKISIDAKKLISIMNSYGKVKSKSITNEKKSRAKSVIERVQALLEKLIVVNKGAKSGQIIILAGGAASGKGNAVKNYIDTSSYKVFDVDALKELVIAVAKRDGNKDIADLDLKKPEDVFKLHSYVDKKGLESKFFDMFVSSIKAKKELPNILFDVTLKDLRKMTEKTKVLFELGYKPENTHIIWVVADYKVAIVNNSKRPRVVPEDILFQTHNGAAETMNKILKGNIPSFVNGEIYVTISDKDLDDKKFSKDGGFYLKDFLYFKAKDAGSALKPEKEIQKQVFDYVKGLVPDDVKNLF